MDNRGRNFSRDDGRLADRSQRPDASRSGRNRNVARRNAANAADTRSGHWSASSSATAPVARSEGDAARSGNQDVGRSSEARDWGHRRSPQARSAERRLNAASISASSKKNHGSSARKRRKSPSDERLRSDESHEDEDPALRTFVERLRFYISEEDPSREMNPTDVHVDMRTARYLLEASSGNVDMATTLYYEEFLATLGARNAAGNADVARAPRNMEDETVQPNISHHGDQDDEEGRRRVRRRLDDQFENADADEDHLDNFGMEPVEGADQHAENGNHVVNAAPADENDQEGHDADHGVSVSDDEMVAADRDGLNVDGNAARRRRSSENRARQRNSRRYSDGLQAPNHGVRRAALQRHVSDNLADKEGISGDAEALELSRKPTIDENDNDDEVDSEISDDDWLNTFEVEVMPPSSVIWGSRSTHESEERDLGDDNHNVVAKDSSSLDAQDQSTSIPFAWINAGFQASSCGTGVIARPPSDTMMLRLNQQQRGFNSTGSSATPPYHCHGVTLLLSMVTALLYTGASIQGSEVNCSSDRKPFSELSEKERIAEFDSRLIDALSSLIYIAARASMARREKTRKNLNQAAKIAMNSDSSKRRQQMIGRKMRLCATCCWEEDEAANDGLPPEGKDAGKRVKLATSLTSIQDIKSYVISNLRSFTGRGGCALFLETIVCIHGKSAVAAMLKRARKKLPKTASPGSASKSLVSCTCEEQWKKRALSSATGSEEATVESGVECVGNELLSLLLTGQVYASLKEWSTKGSLELGILSNMPGEVTSALAQSSKKVWLVRGEACYSVLRDSSIDHSNRKETDLDASGTSFELSHWNCWYGERNRSSMRINTARGQWVQPSQSKRSSEKADRRSVTSLVVARRHQKNSKIVSSNTDHAEVMNVDEQSVSTEELNSVVCNGDDKIFYPKQYRRWRFKFNSKSQRSEEEACREPERQDDWIPFYVLSKRQKLIVEMKLSPKINHILWTRWPKATIDSFTPSDGPPPYC